MADLIGALLKVLLVDLVLSGDNAVVIGLAARSLPGNARKQAILLGGGLAVLMRVLLTLPAEFLLDVPYLRAIGGLLLFWVSYRLLVGEDRHKDVGEGASVMTAVKLIVLADLTMSLDNILAVAAVAQASPEPMLVLIAGISMSIPIVLAGGGLVAKMMARLPILVWLGAGILAFTAGELIFEDVAVKEHLELHHLPRLAIQLGLALLLLAIAAIHQKIRVETEPLPSESAGHP